MNEIRHPKDIMFDISCLNIKHYKKTFLFSLIVEIILFISYFIFVVGKGTKFDYSLSIIILTFFAVIIIHNIIRLIKGISKLKSLNREYNIATETDEQRIRRKRTEKFSRILKPETK